MKKFIVAIDQGTTSTRSILFDLKGNPLFISQKEFKQFFPNNGWVEHDPIEIWNTQLKAIREVIQKSKIDPKISIATVYRTVKLFEESGILTKHEFKGGKARYEELNEGHHDHLIDVKTGEIIEFVDEEIEKLQKKVAEKYGYKLVDHKLELYGVKKKSQ